MQDRGENLAREPLCAVDLKGQGAKKVPEAAQALIAKHPGSFFASEAALVLAKSAFDAGKLDEARKQLEWVTANGAEEHRGIKRDGSPTQMYQLPDEVGVLIGIGFLYRLSDLVRPIGYAREPGREYVQ